ncbi:PREDICTED: killer cell lectin-like receptor subfamily B member 1B allele B, partial [Pterocles gutturalis]|uniref:killer cell lectin-like receptor subfamily B member 1B allele B n=1 Tax=Pterocles gutturalis TaxID=240206 RepID=UPI0005280D9A
CAGYKLCPQDWQLHEDRCYRLSKEIGKWDQSKTDCENQDSQLVVLRDEKEKEYIKNLMGRSTQPVWIGLSLLQKEWRWVDNTTFDTKKFGTLPGVGCGTLKNKELEIDGCDSEHKWVCQKKSFQLSPAMAEDDEQYTGTI